MPTEAPNPVKLQLLEMRSLLARLSHCFQHLSALRNKHGTIGDGKTYSGHAYIKDKDYDRISDPCNQMTFMQ
jgi:acetyltransferase-like isoleucine patch superfamily enzyme